MINLSELQLKSVNTGFVMVKQEGNARPAFTLIELLVVLAIISLISSVVLASLSDARESAKVTNLVRNFEEIEKAFYMWGLQEGRSDYWSDSELGISDASYPNIGTIINETNLSEYLSTEAESSLGRPFHYVDGNGDISCGASIRGGPAAATWSVSSHDIAGAVDEVVDGGDGNFCGRIQWTEDSGSSDIDLFYKFKAL